MEIKPLLPSTSLPIGLAALVLFLPILAHFLAPQLRKLKSDILLLYDNAILHLDRKDHQTYDIVGLRVYPIKSCRGFTVSKTTVRLHGLDLDRQWMFVDAETNKFVTIRHNPRMTLINTAISDDGQNLLISVPAGAAKDDCNAGGADDGTVIKIPARPTAEWLKQNTTLGNVEIWGLQTDGHIYGPEVNEVVSRFLDQAVYLVYKGPTPRNLRGNGNEANLGRLQSTYFPDQMPILIASESSIAELNSRLVKKGENTLTIERFRPNIIIQGNAPWSEDKWKTVRLSDPNKKNGQKSIVADIVSRCGRCLVPNVEPNTGQRHKTEPWNTLYSYRRVDEGYKTKPCVGMLSCPRREGEVEVGMKLEVLRQTDSHRAIAGF
ncbi:MOSC domain protein [Talaromyces proteolyticus]|uniref:MOSC domain protein n=1 Tax=Talaromyces proteolyticus TaxID=1131652 RepID=A0AAD4L427_9EURO|nr:MOSC domain protein [Talaromyces proteolyticus]KAH8705518.1 MOSC domain protein [Talaromyces proteolyticus]